MNKLFFILLLLSMVPVQAMMDARMLSCSVGVPAYERVRPTITELRNKVNKLLNKVEKSGQIKADTTGSDSLERLRLTDFNAYEAEFSTQEGLLLLCDKQRPLFHVLSSRGLSVLGGYHLRENGKGSMDPADLEELRKNFLDNVQLKARQELCDPNYALWDNKQVYEVLAVDGKPVPALVLK